MKSFFLFFCLFLPLQIANCQVRFGEEVIELNQYPYQVRLVIEYRRYDNYGYFVANDLVSCGGRILTKRFVLTAAHCVVDLKWDQDPVSKVWNLWYMQDVEITVGSLNYSRTNIVQTINTNIVHHFDPRWTPQFDFMHDISLINTQKDILIDNVNVARAVIGNHMSESQAGWERQVSCWGVPTWLGMMGFNPTYSDVLRHATTVIKTDLDCGRDGQMAQYWHQDKICTGGRYTP